MIRGSLFYEIIKLVPTSTRGLKRKVYTKRNVLGKTKRTKVDGGFIFFLLTIRLFERVMKI